MIYLKFKNFIFYQDSFIFINLIKCIVKINLPLFYKIYEKSLKQKVKIAEKLIDYSALCIKISFEDNQ